MTAFQDLPVSNLWIDIAGMVVLAVVLAGLYYRFRKGAFHNFFRWQPVGKVEESKPASGKVSAALGVLFRDVFAAQVLKTCSSVKRMSHLAMFWGFAFLAISTTLAFVLNPTDEVLPLSSPVKVFGNVGGALSLIGFAGLFYVRYREHAPVWRLTRSDVFLMILLLAVVTGFLTQQAVYSAGYTEWVSATFWVHMVFVVGLLATAPFTKFFHAVSKPVALLQERLEAKRGREPLLPAAATKEEAAAE